MLNVVGVIHAKGSSVRFTRKNFCLINRVPLFLLQAINLGSLLGRSNVYIDSENSEILELARLNGFNSIRREKVFADNTTGGVALLKNFLRNLDCKVDIIVQLFPPMPFPNLKEIENAINLVKLGHCNSALFYVFEKVYQWTEDVQNYTMVNGEIPNSQDLQTIKIEIPTVYVLNANIFNKTGSRTPAPIHQMQPHGKYNSLDIDDEEDFVLAKLYYATQEVKNNFPIPPGIRVYVPPIIFWNIEKTRKAESQVPQLDASNILDRVAFKKLSELGIVHCIVSDIMSFDYIGEIFGQLNVFSILQAENKIEACKKFASNMNFNLAECYFFGGSIDCLELIQACGRSFCPEDAHPSLQSWAEPISPNLGSSFPKELLNKLIKEGAIARH